MQDNLEDECPLPEKRFSIACYHCRRSKTKCKNNAGNTIYVACTDRRRECTYPPPGVSQLWSKQPELTGEERKAKRPRKEDPDVTRKQCFRTSDDPLRSPPISPNLWKEVYTAFMLHCSANRMPSILGESPRTEGLPLVDEITLFRWHLNRIDSLES